MSVKTRTRGIRLTCRHAANHRIITCAQAIVGAAIRRMRIELIIIRRASAATSARVEVASLIGELARKAIVRPSCTRMLKAALRFGACFNLH